MEPITLASNTGWSSGKKTKRKQMIRRLIILIVITFTLGFLAGLFAASIALEKEETETVSDIVEEPAIVDEEVIEDSLPWNLTLVNFENPLPEDYAPDKLLEVDNGYVADSRIAYAAKQMISDAFTNDGVQIIALSAYRDYQYQQELYDNKVMRLMQETGCSLASAIETAATVVALPGTSEHQLGMALDLVDARHVVLDESQENTPAYKWLKEHCDEYGFIVRYPNGKTEITGIIYEPWHFRYVGKEAAKVIMEKGITLEEYLEEFYTE